MPDIQSLQEALLAQKAKIEAFLKLFKRAFAQIFVRAVMIVFCNGDEEPLFKFLESKA